MGTGGPRGSRSAGIAPVAVTSGIGQFTASLGEYTSKLETFTASLGKIEASIETLGGRLGGIGTAFTDASRKFDDFSSRLEAHGRTISESTQYTKTLGDNLLLLSKEVKELKEVLSKGIGSQQGDGTTRPRREPGPQPQKSEGTVDPKRPQSLLTAPRNDIVLSTANRETSDLKNAIVLLTTVIKEQKLLPPPQEEQKLLPAQKLLTDEKIYPIVPVEKGKSTATTPPTGPSKDDGGDGFFKGFGSTLSGVAGGVKDAFMGIVDGIKMASGRQGQEKFDYDVGQLSRRTLDYRSTELTPYRDQIRHMGDKTGMTQNESFGFAQTAARFGQGASTGRGTSPGASTNDTLREMEASAGTAFALGANRGNYQNTLETLGKTGAVGGVSANGVNSGGFAMDPKQFATIVGDSLANGRLMDRMDEVIQELGTTAQTITARGGIANVTAIAENMAITNRVAQNVGSAALQERAPALAQGLDSYVSKSGNNALLLSQYQQAHPEMGGTELLNEFNRATTSGDPRVQQKLFNDVARLGLGGMDPAKLQAELKDRQLHPEKRLSEEANNALFTTRKLFGDNFSANDLEKMIVAYDPANRDAAGGTLPKEQPKSEGFNRLKDTGKATAQRILGSATTNDFQTNLQATSVSLQTQGNMLQGLLSPDEARMQNEIKAKYTAGVAKIQQRLQGRGDEGAYDKDETKNLQMGKEAYEKLLTETTALTGGNKNLNIGLGPNNLERPYTVHGEKDTTLADFQSLQSQAQILSGVVQEVTKFAQTLMGTDPETRTTAVNSINGESGQRGTAAEALRLGVAGIATFGPAAAVALGGIVSMLEKILALPILQVLTIAGAAAVAAPALMSFLGVKPSGNSDKIVGNHPQTGNPPVGNPMDIGSPEPGLPRGGPINPLEQGLRTLGVDFDAPLFGGNSGGPSTAVAPSNAPPPPARVDGRQRSGNRSPQNQSSGIMNFLENNSTAFNAIMHPIDTLKSNWFDTAKTTGFASYGEATIASGAMQSVSGAVRSSWSSTAPLAEGSTVITPSTVISNTTGVSNASGVPVTAARPGVPGSPTRLVGGQFSGPGGSPIPLVAETVAVPTVAPGGAPPTSLAPRLAGRVASTVNSLSQKTTLAIQSSKWMGNFSGLLKKLGYVGAALQALQLGLKYPGGMDAAVSKIVGAAEGFGFTVDSTFVKSGLESLVGPQRDSVNEWVNRDLASAGVGLAAGLAAAQGTLTLGAALAVPTGGWSIPIAMVAAPFVGMYAANQATATYDNYVNGQYAQSDAARGRTMPAQQTAPAVAVKAPVSLAPQGHSYAEQIKSQQAIIDANKLYVLDPKLPEYQAANPSKQQQSVAATRAVESATNDITYLNKLIEKPDTLQTDIAAEQANLKKLKEIKAALPPTPTQEEISGFEYSRKNPGGFGTGIYSQQAWTHEYRDRDIVASEAKLARLQTFQTGASGNPGTPGAVPLGNAAASGFVVIDTLNNMKNTVLTADKNDTTAGGLVTLGVNAPSASPTAPQGSKHNAIDVTAKDKATQIGFAAPESGTIESVKDDDKDMLHRGRTITFRGDSGNLFTLAEMQIQDAYNFQKGQKVTQGTLLGKGANWDGSSANSTMHMQVNDSSGKNITEQYMFAQNNQRLLEQGADVSGNQVAVIDTGSLSAMGTMFVSSLKAALTGLKFQMDATGTVTVVAGVS